MSPVAQVPRRARNLQHPAVFAVIAVLFSGCGDQESLLFPDGAMLAEIRLSPQEMVISTGQRSDFEVVLIDENGREHASGPGTPEVRWSIVDSGVAQVSRSGSVEGIGDGLTQVIATVGTVQAAARVIVQPQAQGLGFDGPDQEFEGIVGTSVSSGVAVRIKDASGILVSGVTVRFAAEPGSGSLEPALAVTDAAGIATSSWTLGRRPGVHRASATVPLPTGSGTAALADGGSVAVAPGQSPRNPQQRLRGWARVGTPDEVQVTPSSETTEVGGSVQFEAVVRDKFGNVISDATVTWSTQEEQVASVNPDSGLSEGHADGLALIQAEVDGVTGTGTLVVGEGDDSEPGAAESLTISPGSWTLAVGDTVRLDAVARDAEGRVVTDSSVEWSSSNPAIATVSEEGTVTTMDIGAAIITAALICTSTSCSEVTSTSEGEVEAQASSDPSQVTDLRIVESSPTSLTVEFTQVDDGTGAPADYALRYGTPTISWGPAASTEVELSGSEIGRTSRYEFVDLNAETSYEFQLVAFRGTLGASATFGELSNKVTATTEAIEPGEPAWVTISPPQATIRGIGNTVGLSADVRDADGNLVSDASVEWSSVDPSIATVTEGGIVEARALGTTLIVASVLCGASACGDSAEITATEPSEVHPNEPAGFQAWFQHDWQSLPDMYFQESNQRWYWDLPYAASGVGYFNHQGHFGRADAIELVDDPGAPHGYGRSMRFTVREGWRSGVHGVSWTFTEETSISDSTPLNPFYLSYWIMWEPNPADGSWDFGRWRTFTVNRHHGQTCNILSDFPNFSIDGRVSAATSPRWWLWGAENCSQGHWTGKYYLEPGPTVGIWYHIEMLTNRIDPYSTTGGATEITIWINGEERFNDTITTKMENPFRQWLINNNASYDWSFGEGEQDIKRRDDWVRFSGFYASGVPFDG